MNDEFGRWHADSCFCQCGSYGQCDLVPDSDPVVVVVIEAHLANEPIVPEFVDIADWGGVAVDEFYGCNGFGGHQFCGVHVLVVPDRESYL